jgi:hypothetical protein
VVEAVQEAAADGTTFGAPTEREVELAEEICAAVPSVEKVRLVSSTSRSVGAPKVVPSAAASCTASTTSASECPKTRGPQDCTQST